MVLGSSKSSEPAARRRSRSRRVSVGEIAQHRGLLDRVVSLLDRRSRLLVGEPRAAAHHRAVEPRATALAAFVELHLDREHEPVDVRPQRARIAREALGQHRDRAIRGSTRWCRRRSASRSIGEPGSTQRETSGDRDPEAMPAARRARRTPRRRGRARWPDRW
jgi:hypothetical protein